MKRLLPILLLLLACPALADEAPAIVHPYEDGAGFEPQNVIDICVLAELERQGIQPANRCSDAVFLRRAYVDVLGVLPNPTEVDAFLKDRRPNKRAALVDRLLERPDFADYLALKWCDLLRIKAEFPIKLWPNGVQAYYRWLADAMRSNMPFDEFARALLTSSGSNFRVAPVNFYRGVQSRTPEGLAAAVALTFMCQRFEAWPTEKQKGMAAFFSRVRYKKTAEWKEEIVHSDPMPEGPVEAVFPDGKKITIPADTDPRFAFTEWLLHEENPYFARAIANRVWSWLLGRGVTHEPDDMRDDNPPSNPALLTCLARELQRSGYDVRQLMKLILTSRTYQGSPIPQSGHPQAAALFSHYLVRRLPAEVLIDALCRFDGRGQNYLSMVPEPFTIMPNKMRSVTLADGTITSPFLEMFGRPARDTGYESERNNEFTDAQLLHLLNSSDVQRRITRSPWLRQIINRARRNPLGAIRPIYKAILARDPTSVELAEAAAYYGGPGRDYRNASHDLAWALVNSKEFLYRH